MPTSRTPKTGQDRLAIKINEAAETLAISRRQLYVLLAAGELKSVRIGGHQRVLASSIRAFVLRGGVANVK